MTLIDTDTANLDERLDQLIEQLTRLGIPLAPEVDPQAAAAFPPNVAAGELITSAWGNAVVNELKALRGELHTDFQMPGGVTTASQGTFDIGTVVLGPYASDVRVAVQATVWWGFNGTGDVVCQPYCAKLFDSGQVGITPGGMLAHGSRWAPTAVIGAWDVPAGGQAGFKLVTGPLYAPTGGGTSYFKAAGTYVVKRM